ncbi:hypothetical protein MTsDn5_26320 [Alteromonas gracilis]|uniref:CatB-related O-acetyltransferase n=1 Tax=Alteromonas gracilis TaxID=1479524 RepID=UPI0036F23890
MNLEEKLNAFLDGKLSFVSKTSLDKGRDIPKMASEIGARNQSQLIASNQIGMFIGAYSYINNGGYLRDNVFIGRFCSIGRRVTIGAGMHNMYGLSTHPLIKGSASSPFYEPEQNVNPRKGFTVIESDVWIGDGVVITPGVTIGQGAIIGANSVVTKDVAPYSIVGGVPAKVIRQRFPENIIQSLLATEWYEYSLEDVSSSDTKNITNFLEGFNKSALEKCIYETAVLKDA